MDKEIIDIMTEKINDDMDKRKFKRQFSVCNINILVETFFINTERIKWVFLKLKIVTI